MLIEVTTNPESDKSLVVALDTIARYILGPDRVDGINSRNQARVKQIRTKSCNVTSPQYFRKVSPIGRSSRNFNSDEERLFIFNERFLKILIAFIPFLKM